MICLSPIGSGTGFKFRYPIIKYFSENTNIDLFINNKKYNSLKNIKILKNNRKNTELKSLCHLKTDIFKKYKFVLVLDNNNSFGSFSEKLIDVFGSLSVPIYYSSVNIYQIFPDLFNDAVIDGSQYNLDDLINLIHNMTDDEYNKRVNNIKNLRNKYYNACSYHGTGTLMIKYIINSLE